MSVVSAVAFVNSLALWLQTFEMRTTANTNIGVGNIAVG
jgi:hypothetical protein